MDVTLPVLGRWTWFYQEPEQGASVRSHLNHNQEAVSVARVMPGSLQDGCCGSPPLAVPAPAAGLDPGPADVQPGQLGAVFKQLLDGYMTHVQLRQQRVFLLHGHSQLLKHLCRGEKKTGVSSGATPTPTRPLLNLHSGSAEVTYSESAAAVGRWPGGVPPGSFYTLKVKRAFISHNKSTQLDSDVAFTLPSSFRSRLRQ